MMANKAAAIRFRPLTVDGPKTLGTGNCRTPHLGHISALALMTEPQFVQNFSSMPRAGGGGGDGSDIHPCPRQSSFILPHFEHCAITPNRSGSLMSGPCSASSLAVRSRP